MQAFAKMFKTSPDDLDMHVIYDVSHNIAKVEEHFIEGKIKTLLVHRKGSTRAFPPHHPLIPVDYQVSAKYDHWFSTMKGILRFTLLTVPPKETQLLLVAYYRLEKGL